MIPCVRYACCLCLSLLFCGCGTTYGPTGQYGGFPHGGYNETRVSADKFIVSFSGNNFVPEDQAVSYLLYRCAQLTVDNGYNYFVVLSTTTSSQNMAVKTSATYHPVASIPGTYYRSVHFDSYQLTNSQAPQPDTAKLHGAVAVIQLFQAPPPMNVPNTYNANDLLAHLGPL